MNDDLRRLEEFESEDFDLGAAGDQEGYLTAESEQFEPENYDGYDQFGNGSNGFEPYMERYDESEAGGYGELEFESEGDPFFGKLWNVAKKVGSVVAPLAKKFAPQIGSVIGGALGGPAGAAIGGKLGGFVQQMEAEDEGESEDEMNATLAVPSMEDQLSESVAMAASKGHLADAQSLGSQITIFVGQRAPLPVKTVLPVLSQASGDVARFLVQDNDPRGRALVRTLPEIQRRTLATLAEKARNGKPVSPRIALRVMAKHANRTFRNPQAITRALANNAAKKRGLDRRAIARAEGFG